MGISVCVCVCVNVCIYVYVYIYTYIHMHNFFLNFQIMHLEYYTKINDKKQRQLLKCLPESVS